MRTMEEEYKNEKKPFLVSYYYDAVFVFVKCFVVLHWTIRLWTVNDTRRPQPPSYSTNKSYHCRFEFIPCLIVSMVGCDFIPRATEKIKMCYTILLLFVFIHLLNILLCASLYYFALRIFSCHFLLFFAIFLCCSLLFIGVLCIVLLRAQLLFLLPRIEERKKYMYDITYSAVCFVGCWVL